MREQDIKVAESIFEKALQIEGFSGSVMAVNAETSLDFISAVAGRMGGLASLMMASDRMAVLQYGVRLWDCGYTRSDVTGDGIGITAIEDFSSREVAATYRAIDSIDASTEVGLALMLARDAVIQMCEKAPDGTARLNPVQGFFFNYEANEETHEIPFESASDICAFGWRQMMVANRDLVLSLGKDLKIEPQLNASEPSAKP
jgi:hypothetical protein